jgi:hypothetical protein
MTPLRERVCHRGRVFLLLLVKDQKRMRVISPMTDLPRIIV